MTEFNLMNGQAIELTKDGILFKGNRIEIDGKVIIDKDDKHIAVLEQDKNKIKQSSVDIDDKPITTKINLNTALVNKVIDNLLKEIETVKLQRSPRVHIEFDHINDVPTIFIDGEKVQDGLVSLNIDWKTNTEKISEKTFTLKTINKDGYETITGENSLF
ncbi:hypothetical protein [Leuconostoc pseudomesenteroides]|uniref:hypothetical protein n=1 Tax=Leuconostoc pseudomesenteroides TaxID=33968 RepID=UPI0039E9D230